jgi:hypothetical protein
MRLADIIRALLWQNRAQLIRHQKPSAIAAIFWRVGAHLPLSLKHYHDVSRKPCAFRRCAWPEQSKSLTKKQNTSVIAKCANNRVRNARLSLSSGAYRLHHMAQQTDRIERIRKLLVFSIESTSNASRSFLSEYK